MTPTPKQRILAAVLIVIIAGMLIYTWAIILSTDNAALWQNYVGIALFLPLPYLYFRNYKMAVYATGIYLLLGTFTLLSVTPDLDTDQYGVTIGPISLWIPTIQLPLFGLLMLYLLVNFRFFASRYNRKKYGDSDNRPEHVKKWMTKHQRNLVEDKIRIWRKTKFEPRPTWDHQHCALCWEKIAAYPDCQQEGYTDEQEWLCIACHDQYIKPQ